MFKFLPATPVKYMRSVVILATIQMGVLCQLSTLWAYDCLNIDEKRALWEEAKSELDKSDHLIYQDKSIRHDNYSYPGFVVSNETHHYTVASKLDRVDGDLFVGFGSNINFNLIGARAGIENKSETPVERPRSAVFADLSPDVLIGIKSYWRVMFLASENPEQWLSHVSGTPYIPNSNLQDIFSKIKRNRNEHSKGIDELKAKLNLLKDGGKITDVDLKFALAVIEEEFYGCNNRKSRFFGPPRAFSESVFKNVACPQIAMGIKDLYDPAGLVESIEQRLVKPVTAALKEYISSQQQELQKDILGKLGQVKDQVLQNLDSVSFLTNKTNYGRIKRVFDTNSAFYAQALLEDKKFWEQVGKHANQNGRVLTDTYLTCIPLSFSSKSQKEVNDLLDEHLAPIPIGPQGIQIIESTCGAKNPELLVRHLHPSVSLGLDHSIEIHPQSGLEIPTQRKRKISQTDLSQSGSNQGASPISKPFFGLLSFITNLFKWK